MPTSLQSKELELQYTEHMLKFRRDLEAQQDRCDMCADR
jgi:hypothetical protein